MGFNKCYLPSIESMEQQIKRDGLKEFVRLYSKYDCITGEIDSFKFLENKIEEFKNKTGVENPDWNQNQ